MARHFITVLLLTVFLIPLVLRGGEVSCPDKAPCEVEYCDQSPWKFEIGLPAWAAWTEGSVSVGNLSASGSYAFDEAMDDLDYAPIGLTFAAKYNRIGYRFDFLHMSVSPGRTFENRRVLESVQLETKQTRLNQYLLFDILKEDCFTLSVGGGLRYFGADSTLRVATGFARFGLVRTSDLDIWDLVAAVEARICLSEKAFLRAFGDYGGTDSDVTWQVYAGGGYYLTDSCYLSLDYRHLEQEITGLRASAELKYKGPQLGLNFVF